jgi:subtilisin family serine protease
LEEVVDLVKLVLLALLATLVGYMLGVTVVYGAEPVRIAVVDSGVDTLPENLHLCPSGHRDFTNTNLKDDLGHGNAITSIIASHLPEKGACIIIVKVFSRHRTNHALSVIEGLRYVVSLNVQYVNLSLAGLKPLLKEEFYIRRMLAQGKTIIAASGNNGFNFSRIGCVVYPACYDKKIIVVGDTERKFNKGAGVDRYEDGSKQYVGGLLSEGTSLATAHATGLLVAKRLKKQLKR